MENGTLLQDRNFKKAATGAVGLFSIFLIVAIISDIKEFRFIGGSVPATNTITVSGEGDVFAVPDIAEFSFSATEERSTAKDAQDASAEKINAVVDYLKKQGIAEEDIKTIAYNAYPRYEYQSRPCTEFSCPPSERVFKGFEVTQTIQVKVRDTEIAGKLLSGVGEFGATNISGLSFTIEDEEALQSEAREKAISNAREKAEKLAHQLDVSLVRVVSFSESGGPLYPYGVGGGIESRDAAIVPEIPTGENKITSFVTITYEIR